MQLGPSPLISQLLQGVSRLHLSFLAWQRLQLTGRRFLVFLARLSLSFALDGGSDVCARNIGVTFHIEETEGGIETQTSEGDESWEKKGIARRRV